MRRNMKQDFNAAMDQLYFSVDDREDMVQKLMQTRKEQSMHQSTKRKLVMIALAAALALITLTGAAVFTRWSKSAQNQYRPSQEIREQAEKSGLSVMLEETKSLENPTEELSVTDQGITVTAVQSIVDKYSTMVVLRIDGFDLPDGEKPSLSISSAEITDVHTIIPPGRFYDGITTDETGRPVYADGSRVIYDADGTAVPRYAAQDGSLEYYTIFSFSNGENPVGKDISVHITEIGTETNPSLVRGDWELSWTLSGTPDVRHCPLDTVIGNTDVTLLETEISPISIFAAYKMDNADGHIHHNDPSSDAGRRDAHKTIEFLMTGIRMKDGTTHHFGPATGVNSMYSDAGVKMDFPEYADEIIGEKAVLITKSRLIGTIIDPSEVDALIFQKSLPVRKDTSEMVEEDFFILPLG